MGSTDEVSPWALVLYVINPLGKGLYVSLPVNNINMLLIHGQYLSFHIARQLGHMGRHILLRRTFVYIGIFGPCWFSWGGFHFIWSWVLLWFAVLARIFSIVFLVKWCAVFRNEWQHCVGWMCVCCCWWRIAQYILWQIVLFLFY